MGSDPLQYEKEREYLASQCHVYSRSHTTHWLTTVRDSTPGLWRLLSRVRAIIAGGDERDIALVASIRDFAQARRDLDTHSEDAEIVSAVLWLAHLDINIVQLLHRSKRPTLSLD